MNTIQNRTYTYVVGDRFEEFSKKPNVITISELENCLFLDGEDSQKNVYVLGQGVSFERFHGLSKQVKNNGTIQLEPQEIEKSGKLLIHKQNSSNFMISLPKRLSENSFEATIHIDDQCAEMSDHVTGQHIQGMVLLEACRQMFLAVTEHYFLKKNNGKNFFVINEMSVKYLSFAFPLPMKIEYQVIEHFVGDKNNHKFHVSMNILQNEQVCTTTEFRFSTYLTDFITVRENKLAKESLVLHSQNMSLTKKNGRSLLTPYHVFMDVDETIINLKSMFDFMDFYEKTLSQPEKKNFGGFKKMLNAMRKTHHRHEINSFYYRFLKGQNIDSIRTLCEEWFDLKSKNQGFFNTEILQEIKKHQEKTAKIVFVSGSFLELLQPLGRTLNVNAFLCAPLAKVDDQFTGELLARPTIGEGKAEAIIKYSITHNIQLSECYAYGDDLSDIPMLLIVGHPHLVNPCPETLDKLGLQSLQPLSKSSRLYDISILLKKGVPHGSIN